MMSETTRPFRSEPFCLTSYRPIRMQYDEDDNEKEPHGYVDDHKSDGFRFDQINQGEVSGGNWYFNLAGNTSFGGSGYINIGVTNNPHPDEFWIVDTDETKLDWYWVYYNSIQVNLMMIDRWEDHIPFKDVKYVFEKIIFKKVRREQIHELQPPNEFGLITSIPQGWEVIEEVEEEVSFEFTLPDDIDLENHDFDSSRLTTDKLIEGGFIFPKNSGSRHDGDPIDGYEALRYELKQNVYKFDETKPWLGSYQVTTKEIEVTITYDFVDVMDNCSPPAFYNQE